MKIYKTNESSIVSKIDGLSYSHDDFLKHLAEYNMSYADHDAIDYSFSILDPLHWMVPYINIIDNVINSCWSYQEFSNIVKIHDITAHARQVSGSLGDGKTWLLDMFVCETNYYKLRNKNIRPKKHMFYLHCNCVDIYHITMWFISNAIRFDICNNIIVESNVFQLDNYKNNYYTVFVKDADEASLFSLRWGDYIVSMADKT